MKKELKSVTSIAFIIMMVTILSKVSGFFREILIGYYFGTTSEADAFFIAFTIPTVLFSTVGVAIGTSFIPIYSKVKLEKGSIVANTFTNKTLNLVLLIAFLLTTLGMIFTKEIVLIFANGFDNITMDLTVELTRIMFPIVIFMGIAVVLSNFLQANGELIIPALINIPSNVILIVFLWYSPEFGIHILGIAVLIGGLFQVLIQIPHLFKAKFKYQFDVDFKDPNMKKVALMTIPVLIGTSIEQVNVLVDRLLASYLKDGAISVLNYSSKVSMFLFGIISIAIVTIVYPLFSTLTAEKNLKKLREVLLTSLNIVNILLIPIVVIVVMLAEPIVKILFERGAFTTNDTFITSKVLIYYSIGAIFISYRDVLYRVFYSFEDTKIPMINGSLAFIFNIILNIILVQHMGVYGLALGTSLSTILTTFLLFNSLKKKINQFDFKRFYICFLKCIFASVIMGAVTYVLKEFIYAYMSPESFFFQTLNIIVIILISLIIYTLVIKKLKITEVDYLVSKRKQKSVNQLL